MSQIAEAVVHAVDAVDLNSVDESIEEVAGKVSKMSVLPGETDVGSGDNEGLVQPAESSEYSHTNGLSQNDDETWNKHENCVQNGDVIPEISDTNHKDDTAAALSGDDDSKNQATCPEVETCQRIEICESETPCETKNSCSDSMQNAVVEQEAQDYSVGGISSEDNPNEESSEIPRKQSDAVEPISQKPLVGSSSNPEPVACSGQSSTTDNPELDESAVQKLLNELTIDSENSKVSPIKVSPTKISPCKVSTDDKKSCSPF